MLSPESSDEDTVDAEIDINADQPAPNIPSSSVIENNHSSSHQIWKPGRLERLLRAWKEVIRNNTTAHRKASVKLKKRFYIMGGTAAALGALITAINLAFAQDPIEWLMITTNIATGGVAALTALVTILGDDGSSVKHHEAANRYQALEMLIMNIMGTPSQYREDPASILNGIRQQFDDISSSTPMLPGKDEERLEFRVNKRLPKILDTGPENIPQKNNLTENDLTENNSTEINSAISGQEGSESICDHSGVDLEETPEGSTDFVGRSFAGKASRPKIPRAEPDNFLDVNRNIRRGKIARKEKHRRPLKQEDVVIPIDLNQCPNSTINSLVSLRGRIENERCRILNNNNRYDVLAALYQQDIVYDSKFRDDIL